MHVAILPKDPVSLFHDSYNDLCINISQNNLVWFDMSHDVRKPDFCICENKDADQLRGNREADQRLCFRHLDSTIPLLPKSEISCL